MKKTQSAHLPNVFPPFLLHVTLPKEYFLKSFYFLKRKIEECIAYYSKQ